MTYEAVVYFASPRTRWAGKLHEEDIIFRREYHWRWLAKMVARSTHSRLDATRCGYAVLTEGAAVEQVEHVEIAAFRVDVRGTTPDLADLPEILRRNDDEIMARIRRGRF